MENTFEATHVLNFTDVSGCEVAIHPMGQTLQYRFFSEDKVDEPVEAEVQYTDGDAYSDHPHNFFITAEGVYYDLDDFIDAGVFKKAVERRSNVGMPRTSSNRKRGTR